MEIQVRLLTNTRRPIIYPSGEIIAHDKRYIQEATLSGNLNMPTYKSKLVNEIQRNFYGIFCKKKTN